MNEINYETFTDFVAGLTAGSAKAQHEELQVNRNSPVIGQPVGFRLHVSEQNNASLFDHLADGGLNRATIVEQLKKYSEKTGYTLSDELTTDALQVINRHVDSNGTIQYDCIAPRQQAVTLTQRFDNKEQHE